MAEIPPSYTHYPRPNYQTAPYSRPPGVYIETIGDAAKMIQADLGVWVLATIITAIIAIIVSALGFGLQVVLLYGGNFEAALGNSNQTIVEALVLQLKSMTISLFPSVFTYLLFFGLSNMAVRKAQGLELAATDVLIPFRRLGPVYLTLLLCTIAWYLGWFALIVPGIYLSGALSLAPLIALNQNVGPIDAMKMSVRTLGSQAWMMFLVLLVGYIVWTVGALACLVGLLFTTPLYAAVIGLHYHYFFPPVASAYVPTPDVPSSY